MKNPNRKTWLVRLPAAAAPAGVALALALSSWAVSADSANADAKAQKNVEVARYTQDIIDAMDADKNHEVSKAEFLDFMSKEFDRLDAIHDGKLQQSEIFNKQIIGQQKTSVSRR
jgi:hypothetical protein